LKVVTVNLVIFYDQDFLVWFITKSPDIQLEIRKHCIVH